MIHDILLQQYQYVNNEYLQNQGIGVGAEEIIVCCSQMKLKV